MFLLVDFGKVLCLFASSSRTQMILLENRQSIHPIDTYVHKEAYDFTLEDLEDIILFLGLNYVSKKNFPAFFITKRNGLLFRSAGRGILV